MIQIVKNMYPIFALFDYILYCLLSLTCILVDGKASKYSETQVVESLQILHAEGPEDKCLGDLKMCASFVILVILGLVFY